MKKDQVRIGNHYTAKVSGGIAQVKITDERWLGDEHKGWKGVNTATGRAVTIKSAQRLRAAVGGDAPSSGDVGPVGAEVVGAAGSPKPPAPAKPAATKAATKAKEGAKGAKAAKPEAKKPPAKPAKAATKNGQMSGLDAAHKVLCETKKPLNCKELVAAASRPSTGAARAPRPRPRSAPRSAERSGPRAPAAGSKRRGAGCSPRRRGAEP